MLGDQYFFNRDSFTSGDPSVGFRYGSDEDNAENDEDDLEFLQDIPYTSSSLDRSSIGSIPWADDAIKKNQLDWERVERMLHGQEDLTDEQELRTEILEWQRKFPELIKSKSDKQQQSLDSSNPNNVIDSLDLDSISDLSLNSLNVDEHDQFDNGTITPTNKNQQPRTNRIFHVFTKSREQYKSQLVSENLIQMRGTDLRISSVPLNLRHRYALSGTKHGQMDQRVQLDIKTATLNLPPKFMPSPPQREHDKSHSRKNSALTVPSSVSAAHHSDGKKSKMSMPPILNELETKRRFRGLPENNCSFVQLSHVQQHPQQQQQVKSAAVVASHHRAHDRLSGAWQLPLTTATTNNRFSNNRNSIVLPSIHLQRAQGTNGRCDNSDLRVITNSTMESFGVGEKGRRHFNLTPQRHALNQCSGTTTPSTSSTGRSISAAVHPRSRYEFNAFYLPYSASKFKVLK